jgi:hypothetical protein
LLVLFEMQESARHDVEILGWSEASPYRSAAMMVACIRCSGRATTMLTYDHAGAHAFLDDVHGHERGHDGMMLCEDHAGRFVAPVGWVTSDRRTVDPRLFIGEDR